MPRHGAESASGDDAVMADSCRERGATHPGKDKDNKGDGDNKGAPRPAAATAAPVLGPALADIHRSLLVALQAPASSASPVVAGLLKSLGRAAKEVAALEEAASGKQASAVAPSATAATAAAAAPPRSASAIAPPAAAATISNDHDHHPTQNLNTNAAVPGGGRQLRQRCPQPKKARTLGGANSGGEDDEEDDEGASATSDDDGDGGGNDDDDDQMDTEWVASGDGDGASSSSSSSGSGGGASASESGLTLGAKGAAAAAVAAAAAAAAAARAAAVAANAANEDDDDPDAMPILTDVGLAEAVDRRKRLYLAPLGVRSTSIYHGVSFISRPRPSPYARVRSNRPMWAGKVEVGRSRVLGQTYETEEEAAAAVDKAMVSTGRRPVNADLLRKARALRASGWWWRSREAGKVGGGSAAASAAPPQLPAGVTAAEAEALRPLGSAGWGLKVEGVSLTKKE
jgi:hypothetical protein